MCTIEDQRGADLDDVIAGATGAQQDSVFAQMLAYPRGLVGRAPTPWTRGTGNRRALPAPNAARSVDLDELSVLLREMRDQVSDLRSDLRSLREDLRQLSASGVR